MPLTICPQRLCKPLLIVSVYEKNINKEYWLFQASKLIISADTENAFNPRRRCRAKLLLQCSGRLREYSYGYTHTCTSVVFHAIAMTYKWKWYSLYWISWKAADVLNCVVLPKLRCRFPWHRGFPDVGGLPWLLKVYENCQRKKSRCNYIMCMHSPALCRKACQTT